MGDYYGSGPGWPLPLLAPFSSWPVLNPHAWEFNGWQSQLVLGVAALATCLIARACERTPLEAVFPGMDRMFSDLAVLGFSHRCSSRDCGRTALYRCHLCRVASCGGHLQFLGWGRVACTGCTERDRLPEAPSE